MNLYSFTPYDPRGLGHAYNAACAIVPRPEDLILLMDSDVMLFGRWGEELIRVAGRHPEFDVLTCRATRTHKKSRSQTLDRGRWHDCRDLVQLKQRAARGDVGRVTEARGSVSGFVMAFRKSVWLRTPFPLVGRDGHAVLGIDTAWLDTLRQQGRRIGVLSTLICVHFYRLDTNSTRHLATS